MTAVEYSLLDALRELETLVASPTKPKPNLLSLFARIEEFADQLPQSASPELKHYLQRKSYQKARQLLEDLAGAS